MRVTFLENIKEGGFDKLSSREEVLLEASYWLLPLINQGVSVEYMKSVTPDFRDYVDECIEFVKNRFIFKIVPNYKTCMTERKYGLPMVRKIEVKE